MAARFDAAADRLSFSTPHGTTWTWSFWVFLVSPQTGSHSICYGRASDGVGGYVALATLGDQTFRLETNGVSTAASSAFALSTWHHFVLAVSGNQKDFYANGNYTTPVLSQNSAGTADSGPSIFMGSDTVTHINSRLAAWKSWEAVLSADDMASERYTYCPVRKKDLWAFTPFFSGQGTDRPDDFSGNNRKWTEGGTITDEDDPPLSWGQASFSTKVLAAAAPAGGAPIRGRRFIPVPVGAWY